MDVRGARTPLHTARTPATAQPFPSRSAPRALRRAFLRTLSQCGASPQAHTTTYTSDASTTYPVRARPLSLRPAAVASVSASAPYEPSPLSADEPPWWHTHQQAVQLLVSAVGVSCLLAGGVMWARWATLSIAASSKQQDTPSNTNSTHGSPQAAVDPAAKGPEHTLIPGENPSTAAAGARAPVDDLSDPFAPIRYIWRRTFGGKKDPQSDTAGKDSTEPAGSSMGPSDGPASTVTGSTAQGEGSSGGLQIGGSGQGSMPPGWWRDLTRVYYINCGARYGIMPRVALPAADADAGAGDSPTSQRAPTLVAFADRADAEYVSGCLRRAALIEAAASAADSDTEPEVAAAAAAMRPVVVTARPGALEDIASSRAHQVSVLPQTALQPFYNSQLTADQLLTVIEDVLSGRPVSVQPQPHDPHTGSQEPIMTPVGRDSQQAALVARLGAGSAASVQAVLAKRPSEGLSQTAGRGKGAGTGGVGDSVGGVSVGELRDLAQTGEGSFDFQDFSEPRPPPPITPPAIHESAASNGVAPTPSLPSSLTTTTTTSPIHTPTAVISANGTLGSSADTAPRSAQGHLESTPQGLPAAPDTGMLQSVPADTSVSSSVTNTQAGSPSSSQASTTGIAQRTESDSFDSVARRLRGRVLKPRKVGQAPDSEVTDSASSGETESGDDGLLAEYELFKQAFQDARAAGWKDDTNTQSSPPVPYGTEVNRPTDSAQGLATSQGPSTAHTNHPTTQPPPTATVDVSGRVDAILSRQGPTDSALVEALEMVVSTPLTTPSEDDDLKEWYAMTGSVGDDGASNTGDRGVMAEAGIQTGAGGGPPAAAAPPASLDALRAELAHVQAQLAQLTAQDAAAAPVAARGAAVADLTARVTTLSDAVSSFTRAPAPTHTTAHHQQQSASTSSLNGHKPDTQVTSSSSRSSPAVQARSDQGSQASVTSSVAQAAPSERKGWGTGWVRRKPIQAKSPDRVIEPTQVTTATTTITAAADQTQQPAAAAAAAAAAASSNGRTVSGATVTEDGAVIVNKRAGRDRPWKRTRDPGERQETVKEAMRLAAASLSGQASSAPIDVTPTQYDDEGRPIPPPDPSIDRVSGIDWDRVQRSAEAVEAALAGDRAAARQIDTGGEKWWQRRFQVVFVPTIEYSDGGVGFLQIDCSLQDTTPDMRVVLFEDRHDCMHCLTIMKQWPAFEWHELTMGALPTESVESEVVKAWQSQQASAGTRGTGGTGGTGGKAAKPAGVVVFRRGKLPMRVGMSEAEFTQVVVYQAAAQLSLSKVGYQFDDF